MTRRSSGGPAAIWPPGITRAVPKWLGPAAGQAADLGWLAPSGSQGGYVHHISRLSIRLGPGRRQRDELAEFAGHRQLLLDDITRPTEMPAVISLGSGFGGQGKTLVAAAIAAIYAALRPWDRVVGIDVNADMGNLFDRLGGLLDGMPEELWPMTVRAFFQACKNHEVQNYTDLRDLVAWLQNVAVIRGDDADARLDHLFGAEHYVEMLADILVLCNIIINDGGTKLLDDLHTGALRASHQFVFVTEATRLGFKSAVDALRVYIRYNEWNYVELMHRAILVFNKFDDTNPTHLEWVEAAREQFADTGIQILTVPFDPALTDRSEPLDLSAVQPGTLDDLLIVAAAILRGVNSFHNEVGDPLEQSRRPKPANIAALPILMHKAQTVTDAAVTAAGSGVMPQSVGTGWPAHSAPLVAGLAAAPPGPVAAEVHDPADRVVTAQLAGQPAQAAAPPPAAASNGQLTVPVTTAPAGYGDLESDMPVK